MQAVVGLGVEKRHVVVPVQVAALALVIGDAVARIDFEPTEKSRSLALVQLKDGSVKKLSVDGRSALYGKTGKFSTYVKELVNEWV